MIIDERAFREYLELLKFNNTLTSLSVRSDVNDELSIYEMDAVYAAQGTNDFIAMLETFKKKMYSK